VLREKGFRIMIYTKDHAPAHVHVIGQGEIIVDLGGPDTPVSVSENFGMSNRDERRALEIVGEYQEQLPEVWRSMYGQG